MSFKESMAREVFIKGDKSSEYYQDNVLCLNCGQPIFEENDRVKDKDCYTFTACDFCGYKNRVY